MISVGIIGESQRVTSYMSAVANLDGFDIAGCYSPDYGLALSLAKPFHVVAYKSLEALMNMSDVIVITDPMEAVANYASKIIRNLKHLLIADVSNISVDLSKQLFKLAEESDSQLLFGEMGKIVGQFPLISNYCNQPFWMEMVRSFPEEINGSRSEISKYLFDDLSLLLKCANSSVLKIKTSPYNPSIAGGMLNINIEMVSGCVLSINYYSSSYENRHDLTIRQPQATIFADFINDKLIVNEKSLSFFEKETNEITYLQSGLKYLAFPNQAFFQSNMIVSLLVFGLIQTFNLHYS